MNKSNLRHCNSKHGRNYASFLTSCALALILAALAAKGETTILNAESVDRGYEAVERELTALGAAIRRL